MFVFVRVLGTASHRNRPRIDRVSGTLEDYKMRRWQKMIGGSAAMVLAGSGLAMVTSAEAVTANNFGTCVTTESFSSSGQCTVLAGETIEFTIKGGNGGAGGNGGNGGAGGDGWTGLAVTSGGAGGLGGAGGIGGAGARISGTWTNTTQATVTLDLVVGVDGAAGPSGMNGNPGNSVDPVGPSDSGTTGRDGDQGLFGSDGTITAIELGGSVIVTAGNGTGGGGASPGNGGTGGTSVGNGTAGRTNGGGFTGLDGELISLPDPLPTGWTFDVTGPTEAPYVQIGGAGVAPITVPTTATTPTTTISNGNQATEPTNAMTPSFTG